MWIIENKLKILDGEEVAHFFIQFMINFFTLSLMNDRTYSIDFNSGAKKNKILRPCFAAADIEINLYSTMV